MLYLLIATAQIANNGHYLDNQFILSYLGFAPMDDPSLAVYIAIENPHNCIQYGGTTVGPMVKEVLSDALGITKVSRRNNEIPFDARPWIDKKIYVVPNLIGTSVKDIKNSTHYQFIIRGTGNVVIYQMPEYNESIVEGGTIILYT